jgi:iron complex transport system substrate-binding protein
MRIVSLLPSATEILFGLGADDQVVAITHECDFPPQAQHLPRVTSSALYGVAGAGEIDRHVHRNVHAGSSLYTLDTQLLEKLHPDLIVTQELCEVCAVSYHIVEQAAKQLSGGPRILSLEPSSLADVYANIATLGAITGTQQQAAALIGKLRGREAAVRSQVAQRARPRVVLLEWTDPLMSAGHWAPELIEAAGGAPVLCNPGADSQRIELQAIDEADPDIIVVAPCGFNLDKTREAAQSLKRLPGWNELRAAVSGCVACVDGNAYVNRPGPRLIDTVEIFAEIFQG